MSGSGPSRNLPVGSVLRGTYTIEAVLGEGAFGTVYRVSHRYLGTQAMKVFHAMADPVNARGIIEEAITLSGLIDPHVVRVYEANVLDSTERQQFYMTMEFVPGGTLSSFLDRKVRLDPLSAVKTAWQICSGVGAAHRCSPPIVHRDVKPQNVLIQSVSVDGTPRVKVGDFGLARHVDADSLMTRAAGTVHYLAPEAAWGFCTPASDVYAAGVVLFQLLTGLFPFPIGRAEDMTTASGAREAVLRSRQRPPAPPSAFRMGLPRQVDAVVLRALSADPQDRYRDANALARDLESLVRSLE